MNITIKGGLQGISLGSLALSMLLLGGCGTYDTRKHLESGTEQVPESAYEKILQNPRLTPERPEADEAEGTEADGDAASNNETGRPHSLTSELRMPQLHQQDSDADLPTEVRGERYSFRAEGLPVREALRMFGRMYDLNIYVDSDVSGEVDVDFRNLPLDQTMQLMVASNGLYWSWEDGAIRVRRNVTRTFELEYVRLSRDAQMSAQGSIQAGGGGSSGGSSRGGSSRGGGGGNDSAQTSITAEVTNEFWSEVEEQLRELLSDEGRLVVNRLTGTVQVSDIYPRVQDIEWYVEALKDSMNRQVAIEARIIEVDLRNDQALGIDWSRIDFRNFGEISGQTMVGMAGNTGPAGRGAGRGETLIIDFDDGSFEGLINALEEQGNVRVMSQPRVRTLNNQPALIKVSTDRAFWQRDVTRFVEDGVQVVEVDESATNFSEGLMMTVTPQISSDGRVMLDIAPMITRLLDVSTSPSGDSNAPVYDLKQTSTLVQVGDNETVMIGGLIQDNTALTERKIPLLGNIPLIGRFFRSEYWASTRTELVIFLKPTVIGRPI